MPELGTYKWLATEFYDLEAHRDGPEAFALYSEYALQAQGPVLEPMCGTGRFLIPFLQAGIAIEGFDASPHMLGALRRKYAALSHAEPPVWQQFVQDFSSSKRYSLIFIPYGSWGLITSLDESKKAIATMYSHLASGGKFVVEIETIASVPQPCGVWRRGVHRRDDGSYIAVNACARYDATCQLYQAQCRYELIVDARVVKAETELFEMYMYQFDEMDRLVQNAGFTTIKKYQGYQKKPATDVNAPILIYECIK